MVEYTSASKNKVRVVGSRRVVVQFQDSTRSAIDFEVIDVHRPLISASKLCNNGFSIILAPESEGGSWLKQLATGHKLRLFARNGVYVLPAWIEPAKTGFRRHAEL